MRTRRSLLTTWSDRSLFRIWQRDRSGGGLTVARLDIGGSLAGVFFGSQCIGEGRVLRFCEESFQVVHAPAAPGPGSAAVGQLTGAARLIHANEVDDLPLGDVEAVANGVVEFHNRIPSNRRHRIETANAVNHMGVSAT